MKCLSSFFVFLFLANILSAQVLTDQLEHPEAVVSDGKFLYVGNFGPEFKSAQKDSDGYIAKLDFDGKIVKKDFITGLSAPKGMCIVGKTLYLTDIDVLKGFSLKTGEEVFSLSILGAQFLNDVTNKGKKTLYVSDSKLKKVFEVDIKRSAYKVFAGKDTPDFTNGLWYSKEDKRLYVCGKAAIGFYADGSKTFTKITDRAGSYDGLSVLDNEHLIVTDWQNSQDNGVLVKVHKVSGKATIYDKFDKIEGSADFYFHKKTKTVYIPALASTKIYKFAL